VLTQRGQSIRKPIESGVRHDHDVGGARRATDLKTADVKTTRGGGVAHVERRPSVVWPVGPLAAQPGRNATRLRRSRVERTERHASAWRSDVAGSDLTKGRPVLVAAGLVFCPAISGLFFGVVSGLLVLGAGGIGRAGEVGALVGGVIFASNAAALCILQSSAQRQPAPQAESRADDRTGARAS
jgi:hypothetical protein